MHRAPDPEIFATALAEDRVVLTFDLECGDLAAVSRERHASDPVQAGERPEPECGRAPAGGSDGEPSDVFERGAVVIVEEARHRVRYLPIGDEE